MKPTTVTMWGTLGREDVPGWDLGIPGLAVAQLVTATGSRFWTITHTPSGCGIGGGFRSPEPAVAAAWEIAVLTDWTADADTLRTQTELGHDIKRIACKFGTDPLLAGVPYPEGTA